MNRTLHHIKIITPTKEKRRIFVLKWTNNFVPLNVSFVGRRKKKVHNWYEHSSKEKREMN